MANTALLFAEKNMRSFCIAKAILMYFSSKNINVLENISVTISNKFVINKLVN